MNGADILLLILSGWLPLSFLAALVLGPAVAAGECAYQRGIIDGHVPDDAYEGAAHHTA